jgi:surface polysaccharide O-acyltransferase-like enzyme
MSRFNGLAQGLLFMDGLFRFGVPLFIVLSGFYLSLNPRNKKAIPFYRHSLKFLLIPYVVYSLFYSLLKFRSGISFSIIIRNLLLASASPHLWFSLTIIQLYLLHPFLYSGYKKSRHRWALVIGAFFIQILWSVAVSLFLPNPDLQAAGYSVLANLGKLLFPANIGYFLLGYFLVEHAEEAARWLKRSVPVAAGWLLWIAGAAGMALYWGIPISRGTPYGAISYAYLAQSVIVPPMTMAAMAAIFSFAQGRYRRIMIARKVFHPLGLYSYGIYYMNPFFVKALSWFIRHGRSISPDSIVYYLILFLTVPLATLLAVRVLSRMPFGKYLV